MQNVVCVLEYVPEQGGLLKHSHETDIQKIHNREFISDMEGGSGLLTPENSVGSTSSISRDLSLPSVTTLERAFSLFDLLSTGKIPQALMYHVIRAICDIVATDEEVAEAFNAFTDPRTGRFTSQSLRNFLFSDMLRKVQHGRYYIALSLAEAAVS